MRIPASVHAVLCVVDMKDSFYFSHDSNARNDEKILALREKYGFEGYGLFWALVEMMREDENCMLSHCKRNAIAYGLHCDASMLEKFIDDCINEFNLFESDSYKFWSASLKKRVNEYRERSEKARESANMRWHSERNANAMRRQCKKEKKESKEIKEKKEIKENTSVTIVTPKVDKYPVKDAVQLYAKSFLNATGKNYTIIWGRDCKAMRCVLASGVRLDDLPPLIDKFLSADNKYKGNANVPSFVKGIDRLKFEQEPDWMSRYKNALSGLGDTYEQK